MLAMSDSPVQPLVAESRRTHAERSIDKPNATIYERLIGTVQLLVCLSASRNAVVTSSTLSSVTSIHDGQSAEAQIPRIKGVLGVIAVRRWAACSAFLAMHRKAIVRDAHDKCEQCPMRNPPVRFRISDYLPGRKRSTPLYELIVDRST